MQKLNTQEWAERTGEILESARQALKESKQPEVQSLVKHLPEDPGEGERPISLAFAGQYSAGKSTLIRVLTGRKDIATGAGITTEQTQTLEWNGVEIVDTPGIHTSLRSDHDAISYEAISRADLLVFVITNELFDSHLGNHFRTLAIDREKGYETILVVNKMERTGEGNTPDSRETITEDLRKPLAPFTPEELRITFTDAQSALDAENEQDSDIAGMLIDQANIGGLVHNLNDLIKQKGLNARHTTNLYAIDQVIQDAIAGEPSGDQDADTLTMVYNQNIRVITETRSDLQQSIDNAINRTVTQIRLAGVEYAENFYPEINEERRERATIEIETRLESLWNELLERIEKECTEILPAMSGRLEELHDSHRFQNTLNNLNQRASRQDISKILGMANQAAGRLAQISRSASMNTSAIGTGAAGLGRFSGSATHGAVLNIGKMMGHSFRPWEAVKITRGISTAGAILSVATTILGVYLQAREEREEDRKSEEALKARQDIRAEFNGIAQQVQDEALEKANEYIDEVLTKPLEQIQQYADELNLARQDQNRHIQRLTDVSQDARALIGRIHSAGTA